MSVANTETQTFIADAVLFDMVRDVASFLMPLN